MIGSGSLVAYQGQEGGEGRQRKGGSFALQPRGVESVSQALTVLNAGKKGTVGLRGKGSVSKQRPKVAFDSALEGAKGGQALPVGLLEWSAVLQKGGRRRRGSGEGQAQRELLSKIGDFIDRMREAQGGSVEASYAPLDSTVQCCAVFSYNCSTITNTTRGFFIFLALHTLRSFLGAGERRFTKWRGTVLRHRWWEPS